jgi:thymidylate synthase
LNHDDKLISLNKNLLKTDPFSRRIMMSYWNPADFEKTALLPCHFSCQFYVIEKDNQKYLSCMFNMRSNDFFLGNPFNIFSYAVLTYILAKRCDMKPDKLIYNVGDMHIYKNHFEQIGQQLTRTVRPAPILLLNDDIKHKNINEITINDFDIVGYFPHPSIKAPMAI